MIASEENEVQLCLPKNDEVAPVISIVIPTLNEELTIREFVAWCSEGLEACGVAGEILIVDSSSDKTADIALELGARVLKTPKRGLGQAYKDAIPFVRGQWVIMGDADCTYDFRDISCFVNEFKNGAEYVMGSRWLGSIEKSAMPFLHQYFGTPITTWILNRIFGSRFTDIHCGMRGIEVNALRRIQLHSSSWEYASELVLKSIRYNLRTVEVPVKFYKDRNGRLSHHKRSGWLSPFKAAWINLEIMLVNGADYFLIKPGRILFTVGSIITIGLSLGPINIGPIGLSIYWMLLSSTLGLIGLQMVLTGDIARIIYDVSGKLVSPMKHKYSFNSTALKAALSMSLGLISVVPLLNKYLTSDLSLAGISDAHRHLAISGLFLMSSSFIYFVNSLLINGLAQRIERTALLLSTTSFGKF
ncbi:MAG: glycosyltransferase family 2 protein [Gammaproteobacteria bacterium]